MLNKTWTAFRTVTLIAAAALVVLGTAAVLALCFWVLPNVNRYQLEIAQAISNVSGLNVRLNGVTGGWSGLRPRLTLSGLELFDSEGHPGLALESVEGTLSWASLAVRRLRFHQIEIKRPVLSVRRDAEGGLYVAGLKLTEDKAEDRSFTDWLFAQHNVIVRHAVLAWSDERVGDQPLVLNDVTLRVQNRLGRHRIGLYALAPKGLSGPIKLGLELDDPELVDLRKFSGSIYAETTDANVGELRKYFALGDTLYNGTGALRVWATLRDGDIASAQALVDLREVSARLRADLQPLAFDQLSGALNYRRGHDAADGFSISTRALQVRLAQPRNALPSIDLQFEVKPAVGRNAARGALRANAIDLGALVSIAEALPLEASARARLKQWQPLGALRALDAKWVALDSPNPSYALKTQFDRLSWRAVDKIPGVRGLSGGIDLTERGGALALASDKSTLSLPKVLPYDIKLDTLTGQASWIRSASDLSVAIENVSFANSDAAGSVFGKYRSLPKGPGFIDLTGKFTRAEAKPVWRYVPYVISDRVREWLRAAVLAGSSDDLRFSLRGDLYDFPFSDEKTGLFQLVAKAKGGVLAYAQEWPKIENMDATLTFRGESMLISIARGSIGATRIARAEVQIPSFRANGDERVIITGESGGALAEHLKLIVASPLDAKFDGFARTLKAQGDGILKLRGEAPVRDIPAMRVVGDYQLLGNSLDDGPGGFPQLTDLRGRFQFTEAAISAKELNGNALGGPITLSLARGNDGVDVTARGKAKLESLHAEVDASALKRLTGEADWNGAWRVRGKQSEFDIRASAILFGGPAQAVIKRGADNATRVSVQGKTNRDALAQAFPMAGWQYLEQVGAWSGEITLRDQLTQVRLAADATVFGGPAKLLVSGSGDKLNIGASGRMNAARLAAALDQPVLTTLRGTTDWSAEVSTDPADSRMKLSSSLVGVSSALPAPLAKSAQERVPLTLETRPLTANQELWSIALGDRANARLLRVKNAQGQARITRGEVIFGAASRAGAVPARDGLWISGRVPALDLTALQAVAKGLAPSTPQPGASPAAALAGIDLSADKVVAAGREFSALAVRARKRSEGWQVTLNGQQIAGEVLWLSQPANKITARFKRVLMPASSKSARPGDAPKARTTGRPGKFPALDITIDDFQIQGNKLGKIELNALSDGANWRIDKLRILKLDAIMEGSGIWRASGGAGDTGLGFELRVTDVGAVLDSLNYKDTVKGGTAEMKGQLAWLGAPYEFDPASLVGAISLGVKSGQFLKIKPGVGKLLGLISLQALPRRITLDFRDVFSEGFRFDAIAGNVNITNGVMRTEDFRMIGPGARVAMKGSADARTETQDLRVKVLPSTTGTVAVASLLAGGPVIGVGAFVLQKLFKDPFDEILAREYDIKGTWIDPQVTKVARPTPEPRPRPR